MTKLPSLNMMTLLPDANGIKLCAFLLVRCIPSQSQAVSLADCNSSMSGQKECLRRRCRGRPSGSNIKRYASCAHPWLSAATDSTS
jgi:hypothetical protein